MNHTLIYELGCLVLFVLVLVLLAQTVGPKPLSYLNTLPCEDFSINRYKPGDLIITFGDYLAAVHPGHLGVVMMMPPYQQLGVWQLDHNETTDTLIPLETYVRINYIYNRRVFVRHINQAPPSLVPPIGVHYDYNALFDYVNYIMSKYTLLPTVFIHRTSPKQQYCSEAVNTVLKANGVLASDPQIPIKDGGYLFLPKLLLEPERLNLNAHTHVPYHYQPPVAIRWR